jgi:hypothetical protein
VADDAGAGQAEVGAEGIQEPAAVAHPISREGFIGLAKTAQVEGINREPLRETSGELFPEARRREPAVNQKNRRPTADDVVADPGSFELQVLGVAGTLYLVRGAPERDGGRKNDADH